MIHEYIAIGETGSGTIITSLSNLKYRRQKCFEFLHKKRLEKMHLINKSAKSEKGLCECKINLNNLLYNNFHK